MTFNQKLEIDHKVGEAWNKQRALKQQKAVQHFYKHYKSTPIPNDW